MTQCVKDPELTLLWHRFDSWTGNFHMLRAEAKKKGGGGRKDKKNESHSSPEILQLFTLFYYFQILMEKKFINN